MAACSGRDRFFLPPAAFGSVSQFGHLARHWLALLFAGLD
jgi:hypothetical protein